MTGNPATSIGRLLNEKEVAALTGINVKTLRAWRLFDRGPRYRKLGGSVRYAESDLSTWINEAPSGGGHRQGETR